MRVIIKDVEQGTPEWHDIRLGIPTCSNFDKLLTPGLKPSSQADEYLAGLIGEYISGKPIDEDGFNGFWMQRGTELEPEARLNYQLHTGFHVTQAAFVYKDKLKLVGGSPDGLVYKGRKLLHGCEIKVPKAARHCAYLWQNACPKKYIPQVQGSMWVSNVPRWDFVSHDPDSEPLIVPVYKDDAYHKALDEIIPAFIERLVDARKSDRVQDLRSQRIEMQEEAA